MLTLLQDLRYGIRMLSKHRLSNIAIIATIALLVGAFSTVYASLANLKREQMPFPESEQLVKFRRIGERRILEVLPAALFPEMRRYLKSSFTELGATAMGGDMTLTGHGEPRSLRVERVTASVLRLAGIEPMLGRLFSEDDEPAGRNPVVVLSNRVWKETFGTDDAIVGQTVYLDQIPCTVIGVMPPAFDATLLFMFGRPHLWIADDFSITPGLQGRDVRVAGRLKRNVTLEQAQTEVETVTRQLELQHPPEWELQAYGSGFSHAQVVALDEAPVGTLPQGYIAAWLFVVNIASCVVLIACFNVTNLLLVRVGTRAHEMAIRFSLGARRWRIMRQMLVESVLLGVLGGVLGLVIALWACGLLRFSHLDASFDPWLYLVSFGSATGLGIAVGFLPALRGTKGNLINGLKEVGQTTGGQQRHRLRNFLVGAQVTMAMVLCVTAGLLTRHFVERKTVDLGFDPDRLLILDIDPRNDTYRKPADRNGYAQRVLQTLEEFPGVNAGALITPPSLFGWSMRSRVIIKVAAGYAEQQVECHTLYVSPKFTNLIGLPILHGRRFSQERNIAEQEALVNQVFVDVHLGGADALKTRIRLSDRTEWLQIVGVVDQRLPLSQENVVEPAIYASYFHEGMIISGYQFLIATATDAAAFKKPVRQVIQSLDPVQPVGQL